MADDEAGDTSPGCKGSVVDESADFYRLLASAVGPSEQIRWCYSKISLTLIKFVLFCHFGGGNAGGLFEVLDEHVLNPRW